MKPLKNIEEMEKGKKIELPPLPPMIETLEEFMTKNNIPILENVD